MQAESAPNVTASGSVESDGRSVSIATLLAVSFGLLVVLAVAAVFFIGMSTSRQNTLGLLNDKSVMIVGLIETRVRNHLDPALHQARFLDRQVSGGIIDTADRDRLSDVLKGMLAAAPQITALAFWDADFRMTAVAIEPDGQVTINRNEGDRRDQVLAIGAKARQSENPFWGEVIYSEDTGFTFVNLIQPLRENGKYEGFVAVVVSMPELSDFMTQVGDQFDATAYILYGGDRVLAHPNLTSRHPDLDRNNPTVRLERVGDPVLASLRSGERARGFEPAAAKGVAVDVVDVAEDSYVNFNGQITDYGTVPWIIGAYVHEDQVNTELRRLLMSVLAGVGILLLSFIAAVMLGRRIASPIRRMAQSAAQVGALELDAVEPLKPSRIRELRDQAVAFNRMLAGLRWFETYVPRTLVTRLMASGSGGRLASTERELSVLFTDIVGFTSLSESMPASETAALLNDHFAMLGACVEAEGGTIDKFIGDALMAFWGAPDPQTDHAARACRAARAIAEAVAVDNAQRRELGLAPLRLRIGIHLGPVVVGNIGAPGRTNYTIVGDTVNAAQRLEALGKELDVGDDVTVLVSAATASAVDRGAFGLEPLGAFEVKGKQARLEVARLRTG